MHAENIDVTVRKLNRLFADLSEGEPMADRSPFEMAHSLEHGATIVLKHGTEWKVATVLEKVLDGELPYTNAAMQKKHDPLYGVPSLMTGDPTHPYID